MHVHFLDLYTNPTSNQQQVGGLVAATNQCYKPAVIRYNTANSNV